MDPNTTLTALREALARYDAARDADDAAWEASDMANHVQALDEWLSKGGFLPEAWTRSTHTAEEISDLKTKYYHLGKEAGAEEGFANGYRLAQEHMHTHLRNHGFTGDH